MRCKRNAHQCITRLWHVVDQRLLSCAARTPLKEEDLIPNTELKAKIEAWKAEMLAQARKNVPSKLA
jgi:hypothetical protein